MLDEINTLKNFYGVNQEYNKISYLNNRLSTILKLKLQKYFNINDNEVDKYNKINNLITTTITKINESYLSKDDTPYTSNV